jgi:hypothetical protein
MLHIPRHGSIQFGSRSETRKDSENLSCFFSLFSRFAHFGATVVNWTADSARYMPCTRQIMLSGSNQERTKSEKTSGNSKLLGK